MGAEAAAAEALPEQEARERVPVPAEVQVGAPVRAEAQVPAQAAVPVASLPGLLLPACRRSTVRHRRGLSAPISIAWKRRAAQKEARGRLKRAQKPCPNNPERLRADSLDSEISRPLLGTASFKLQ